jgi:putative transposase
MRLFHKPGDYDAFEQVLSESLERYPVDLLTYCVMPNHWHLVVRPKTDDALGRWLGWVGVTHVRRHHTRYQRRGGGHLYQGRYKSFPVESDAHFLTLCRYVEANPRRAKLVARAEQWRWSGLWRRARRVSGLPLAAWPIRRPPEWLDRVNERLPPETLKQLRECVQRGRPLGDDDWVCQTAARLGLTHTLRGPGRPRSVNP